MWTLPVGCGHWKYNVEQPSARAPDSCLRRIRGSLQTAAALKWSLVSDEVSSEVTVMIYCISYHGMVWLLLTVSADAVQAAAPLRPFPASTAYVARCLLCRHRERRSALLRNMYVCLVSHKKLLLGFKREERRTTQSYYLSLYSNEFANKLCANHSVLLLIY